MKAEILWLEPLETVKGVKDRICLCVIEAGDKITLAYLHTSKKNFMKEGNDYLKKLKDPKRFFKNMEVGFVGTATYLLQQVSEGKWDMSEELQERLRIRLAAYRL